MAAVGFAQTLEVVIISSGGTLDAQGGGYTLHDLKGQSLAGEVSSEGTTVQVGGLYGLLPEERLQPGLGGVSGEVKSTENGNPLLSGVLIQVYTIEADGTPETVKYGYSGLNGSYALYNIDPGTYYMWASKDGYFPIWSTVTIEADKWSKVDFYLRPGETSPPGTVYLMIARIPGTSNLNLSWSEGPWGGEVPSGGKLDVYMLTGGGSGEFTSVYDANKWKKVVEDSSLVADFSGEFTLDLSAKTLTHKNQVGEGSPEAYYKAVLSDVDPSTSPGNATFESAPVVGKVNIVLYKTGVSGWNFISTPVFLPTLDETLGTDFTKGDQIWIWDDANQTFTAPLTFNGSTWGMTGNFERGRGYLFNLNGTSPKVATLIGRVDLSNFSKEIKVKSGTPSYGWNLIANPFPTVSQMAGFASGKSVKSDSLWEWDSSSQKFIAPLTFDGTSWPAGAQLKIGKAYGYNHTKNGFTWEIPGK